MFVNTHKPAFKINAFRYLVTLKGICFTWRCMGRQNNAPVWAKHLFGKKQGCTRACKAFRYEHNKHPGIYILKVLQWPQLNMTMFIDFNGMRHRMMI